ncbi:membrane insertase COX18 [Sporobolomyces koalae]|uniref:membrane insertase COX18 n=1 Tax=Sporobolomyces koalae TaxID=500713 RepID=UPI00317C5FDA
MILRSPLHSVRRLVVTQPRRAFSAAVPRRAPLGPDSAQVPLDAALEPTLLEPLSSVFLAVPPALAVSYAVFIPLVTVLYRSVTTLPVVLWQRRRTRRFLDLVLPRLRPRQQQIALLTRDECRRANRSYPEYLKLYKQRAKDVARELTRQYRCTPLVTLVVPPLVHIPIFVTATLTLRDACTRAIAALGLDSAAASTTSITTSALDHLHALGASSFAWCPSLVLPDPTMNLPLGVGLVTLLNVELSAKNRLRQTAAEQRNIDAPPPNPAPSPAGGSTVVSASEKRRIVARRARDGQHVRVRPYSTGTATVEQPTKPDTAKIVTNVLRFASIAFIPVAGLAPSAVCLYWITSNLFTLVQNAVFALYDRRRERDKRIGMILSGKSL